MLTQGGVEQKNRVFRKWLGGLHGHVGPKASKEIKRTTLTLSAADGLEPRLGRAKVEHHFAARPLIFAGMSEAKSAAAFFSDGFLRSESGFPALSRTGLQA